MGEIRDVDALVALIAHEVPGEYKQMGTWMWEGLATRGQWTTRLARRSPAWPPSWSMRLLVPGEVSWPPCS